MDRLRIVVGFKVTPDYEALRPADWARAAADGARRRAPRRRRYVRRVLNVFDEAALELALRLRDARAAAGLETSLAAFSVAGREADPFLRTLQALGFERARAWSPAPTSTSPLPRRPRWSPPARSGWAATSCCSAAAAAPATAAWSRSSPPRRSAGRA